MKLDASEGDYEIERELVASKVRIGVVTLLIALRKERNAYERDAYGYAIESDLPLQDVQLVMDRESLPCGVRWFEVAGQRVFPIYGPSGGAIACSVFYLLAGRNPRPGTDMGREGDEPFRRYR